MHRTWKDDGTLVWAPWPSLTLLRLSPCPEYMELSRAVADTAVRLRATGASTTSCSCSLLSEFGAGASFAGCAGVLASSFPSGDVCLSTVACSLAARRRLCERR